MSNIYNMPKLSRINQEKKKALDLLELVKSKLNARTYTSFVNKIDNFKRIDAVKRFSTKLNELQISTDKNISKSTLKQAVEKVIEKKNKASSKITNTLIKKKSKVVDGYNVKQTYERLLSMTGIVKLLVFSGNTLIKEQVIDLTNKKKVFIHL